MALLTDATLESPGFCTSPNMRRVNQSSGFSSELNVCWVPLWCCIDTTLLFLHFLTHKGTCQAEPGLRIAVPSFSLSVTQFRRQLSGSLQKTSDGLWQRCVEHQFNHLSGQAFTCTKGRRGAHPTISPKLDN